MSFFVPKEEVPVTLDGEDVPFEERNTIYIKPKMDHGTRNRLTSAVTRIKASADGERGGEIDMGAYNSAILYENIVRWTGPGFQAMPCTPENIDRLDPELPLLDKVLEEINARNKPKADDDPNSLSASTSASQSGSQAPRREGKKGR